MTVYEKILSGEKLSIAEARKFLKSYQYLRRIAGLETSHGRDIVHAGKKKARYIRSLNEQYLLLKILYIVEEWVNTLNIWERKLFEYAFIDKMNYEDIFFEHFNYTGQRLDKKTISTKVNNRIMKLVRKFISFYRERVKDGQITKG